MSERFFVDQPLHLGLVSLHGAEAHHLAHVSRLRPGAALRLFNGDGHEYAARVVTIGRRDVTLEVVDASRPKRERPFRLEVAAPLPKGDRGQFLVEKLTEWGVTTFIPLACQRSIVHPREGRRDKLQRYVIEASKQCGRNVLMDIQPTTDWASYCARAEPGMLSILAHPAAPAETAGSGNPGRPEKAPKVESLRLAVGPEGGFTDAEVEQARTAGWQVVSLGPRLLRIETAALVLAVLAVEWLSTDSGRT
jgi:16S rRNA (uracil1498-N3)-methyltransferase